MNIDQTTTPEGLPATLVHDRMNWDRWQWRYYDRSMKLWFDYGSPFPATAEGKAQAIDWMNAGGCSPKE